MKRGVSSSRFLQFARLTISYRMNARKEVVEPSRIIKLIQENIMVKCKNDALGMQGCRSRNQNGLLRDKRNDTHIGTIEKQYGIDLGVRSDMQLGTYLEKHNIKSLNDLITGQ